MSKLSDAIKKQNMTTTTAEGNSPFAAELSGARPISKLKAAVMTQKLGRTIAPTTKDTIFKPSSADAVDTPNAVQVQSAVQRSAQKKYESDFLANRLNQIGVNAVYKPDINESYLAGVMGAAHQNHLEKRLANENKIVDQMSSATTDSGLPIGSIVSGITALYGTPARYDIADHEVAMAQRRQEQDEQWRQTAPVPYAFDKVHEDMVREELFSPRVNPLDEIYYNHRKDQLKEAAEKEQAKVMSPTNQLISMWTTSNDNPFAAAFNYYVNYLSQSRKQMAYEQFTAAETEAQKQEVIKNMQEWAKEHPWAASGASIGSSLLSGADYLTNAVETAVTGNARPKGLPGLSETTQALRGGTAENFGGLGKFVYHTGMSAADSVVAGLVGGSTGAGIILGLGAASNTANDIKARGGTDEQALVGGMVAGVLEGVFEKISIGELEMMKELPAVNWKNILGNISKSVVTNASEEGATELGNIVFDTLFMGELSEYTQAVRGYMEQGVSEESAKLLALTALRQRVEEAAASGALMGLFFGAGASAYSAASKYIADNKSYKINDAKSLVKYAMSFPPETASYRMGTQFSGKKNITSAEEGALIRTISQDIEQGNYKAVSTPETISRDGNGNGQATAPAAAQAAKETVSREPVKVIRRANAQAAQQNKKTAAETQRDVSHSNTSIETLRNSIAESYENGTISAEEYDAAMESVYELESLDEASGDALDAYDPERLRRMEANDNGRSSVSDDGGEWTASQSAGEQARQLAEGAGRDQSREVQAQRAASRRDDVSRYYESAGRQAVSAREYFGNNKVNKVSTVQEVPAEMVEADSELQTIAEDIRAMGLTPHFFVGDARLRNGNSVDGMIRDGDVFIRVDGDAWTATHNWDHEKAHALFRQSSGIEAELYGKIVGRGKAARRKLHQTMQRYREAYHGIYDVDENGNEIWNDTVQEMILQEILVDAYAGKDTFAQGVEKYTDVARDAASQIEKRGGEVRGPPEGDLSIEILPDGKKYVRADRQVIFGNDPDSWSEQLEDYINGKIRRGEDVKLVADDGDELVLTSRTAGKIASQYKGGRRISDTEYERHVNAGVHIDELAQVSRRGDLTTADEGDRHGTVAKNGWNYRTAFFQDFDGQYYRCTISVQMGSDGNAVYNIGSMRKRSDLAVRDSTSGSSAKGGAQRENASMPGSVSQDSGDVKFSVSGGSSDTEYMAAVERGDMETAQRMVDEAAKAAGYTIKSYHGTLAKDFNEFKKEYIGSRFSFDDKGFFFIDRQNIAEDYATSDAGEKGRVIEAYLKAKRPLIADANFLLREGVGRPYRDKDVIDVWDAYQGYFIDEVEARHADAIILDDGDTKMTVVFDPDQIKDASPVTYDNNGNVIPLSKRFNPKNKDIRFSTGQPAQETRRPVDITDNLTADWDALERSEPEDINERQFSEEEMRQIEELLDKAWMDENSGGRSSDANPSPVDIEAMPTKARKVMERAERKLQRSLSEVLKLPKMSDGVMDEVSREISKEFLETGTVSDETIDRTFEKVYSAIEDQVEEQYGVDAEDRRKWAERDYIAEIGKHLAEMRLVKRYAAEKAQQQEQSEQDKAMTLSDLKKVYTDLKAARRGVDKAVARNLLTDEDNRRVNQLLRGDIDLDMLRPDVDNIRGITEVYNAKLEYERFARQIRRWNAARKDNLIELADKLLATASDWKDKGSGWLYSRETMERNIRDIVPDKQVAQEIIETLFKPIHDGAAAANKMKNQYRDRVRKLELSRKVAEGNTISEAAAVQLLGEAEDNIRHLEQNRFLSERDGKTLEDWQGIVRDLWEQNPNLDAGKIRKAVKEFREIYDELFEQMNEVRMRNGYEPVNYRKGYFPHFQSKDGDGILGKFGKSLGINTAAMQLPTTINGMTHNFKPGIQWFGSAQQRMGVNTSFDALEGFDSYIEGVADVIHQTDNIQRLRAFASRVRYRTSEEGIRKQVDAIQNDNTIAPEDKQNRIEKLYAEGKFELGNLAVELDEYTNLLAGKKSRHDRDMEQRMGRRMYAIMKALESRVAANMVAINPGSWLTNFIPITQGAAALDTRSLLAGMWDTLKAYKQDDGFVAASTFLTNRRGSDPLVRTWSQEASAKLSTPMELIDSFTADVLVRSRYNENIRRGMSEEAALADADAFAADVMADRSKGAMPTLFSQTNPLTKLLTQFQLEVNNQLSFVFKDLPRNAQKKGKMALTLMLLKFALGAYLYNELYEWLIGRRPALDPINLLSETTGDLTGYKLDGFKVVETERTGVYDAGVNLAGSIAEEMPFIGSLLGGGRLPISSALPDIGNLWRAATDSDWDGRKRLATAAKELAKPAAYLALPFGGGQVKKAVEGISAVARGGSYSVDSKGDDLLQYPVHSSTPGEAGLNAVRAMIFGKSSLPEARKWVESDFDSLGVRQTEVYQTLRDSGVDTRQVYQTIRDWETVGNNDLLSSFERGIRQRRLVSEMAISDQQKLEVYHLLSGSNADSRVEKFQRMMDNGLTWSEIISAYDKQQELNTDEVLKASEKASLFAEWAFRNLTVEKALEVVDELKFYITMPANASQEDLTAALNKTNLSRWEKKSIWADYSELYGWKAKSPW